MRLFGVNTRDRTLCCYARSDLLLKFVLLSLLHEHLVLIKLLNGVGVDVLKEIWGLALRGLVGGGLRMLRLLFDPKVLRRLKIIPEDRDDLLDLVICVLINEESSVFLLGLLLTHTKLQLNLPPP